MVRKCHPGNGTLLLYRCTAHLAETLTEMSRTEISWETSTTLPLAMSRTALAAQSTFGVSLDAETHGSRDRGAGFPYTE